MTTVFSTGPGYYAIDSAKSIPELGRTGARVYCLRLEAYDIDTQDDQLVFELFVCKAEKNKKVAVGLLKLLQSLQGNQKALEDLAR